MKRVDYLSKFLEIESFSGNDKMLAIGRFCGFLIRRAYRRDVVLNFIKTTYNFSEKESSYYAYSAEKFVKKTPSTYVRSDVHEYCPRDDDEKRCLVYDFIQKDKLSISKDQWSIIQFGSLLEGLYIENSRVVLKELPLDKKDLGAARFLINIGRMQCLNVLLNKVVGPEVFLGPKSIFYYSLGFLKEKDKTSEGLVFFGAGCRSMKMEFVSAAKLAMSRSDFEKEYILEKILDGYEKKFPTKT